MPSPLKTRLFWAGIIVLLALAPFLPVLLSGEILFASDSVGAPAWTFYFEALRHGTLPLWNPFQLGGMPTFDAMFGDASYPLFLLLGLILPVEKVVQFNFMLEVCIAGWGAFFLMRRYFNLDRGLSLALAAAYMLNTNFFSHIHAGHSGKFHIMAWLPLSLYCLLRSLDRGTRWIHLLGLCLSVTLFILTSHLQFTYYVLMGYFLAFAYADFLLIREKNYRLAGLTAAKFWVPVLLGVGLAFPIFYPPTQWNQEHSVRGEGGKQTYEHATSWSIHPEELVSLAVPEFGGINEKYWGRNAFKLNSEYPGGTLLFLGIFGLAAFRRRRMWFWGAVGLLAVLFGLGAHTPLFRLFYEFIPGIKSFRAPSMMLFWLATALLMIAAETLGLLRQSAVFGAQKSFDPDVLGKKLLMFGGIAGGFLILCGLAAKGVYGAWGSVFGPESIANLSRQPENVGDFALGAIKNGALVLALTFALRQWVLRESKDQRWLNFSILLTVVTCLDLYWENSRFVQTYPFERYFPREAAVEALRGEKEPFRVFGMPRAYDRGFLQYHKIETVEGFVDQENRLYREYRGGDYQRNANFLHGLQQNADGSVSGSPFLDLLNVKYLAYRLPDDPGLRLAPNKTFLPRAFVVHDWKTEPDDGLLAAMKAPEFAPARTALIPASQATLLPPPPPADTSAPVPDVVAVKNLRRDYNRHEAEVETAKPGILVLSELYFPFWKVRVDGREAPLLRVNHAFRGVYLEPGKHTVRFAYHSPWLKRGLMVSLACAALLGLLLPLYRKLSPRWEWA